MKKFLMFLAIIGLASFAACNPSENKTDKTTADSTQVDSTVVVDSIVAQ